MTDFKEIIRAKEAAKNGYLSLDYFSA